MTQTDEAEPKKTRRRRSTYAKRLELRISDGERKDIEQLVELVEGQTGKRLTLSEAVRMFIRDGGKEVTAAAKRGTGTASGHGDKDRVAEALEEFAEELRLTRTELRRIGNNVNQIARWSNAEEKAPAGLDDAEKLLAKMDRRLVAVAQKAVEKSTWEEG